MDVAKKGKPYEGNGISPDSSTKRYQDQSYQSNKTVNVGYAVIEKKTSIT